MGVRIVTIEDIQEIGDLLDLVLDHPGIELFHAENGVDGLDLIARVNPDLVILDIMLPGITGWVVYDTLRADPDLGHTPVVVLSVLPFPNDRRRQFADSTIDVYVQKPFDAVKIRRLIMRMLERPDLWDLSMSDGIARDSAVDIL